MVSCPKLKYLFILVKLYYIKLALSSLVVHLEPCYDRNELFQNLSLIKSSVSRSSSNCALLCQDDENCKMSTFSETKVRCELLTCKVSDEPSYFSLGNPLSTERDCAFIHDTDTSKVQLSMTEMENALQLTCSTSENKCNAGKYTWFKGQDQEATQNEIIVELKNMSSKYTCAFHYISAINPLGFAKQPFLHPPFQSCDQLHLLTDWIGQFSVSLMFQNTPIDLRCDLDTDGGGWTVFQRRVSADVDFYRGWQEYKEGFGDLETNFWIGLDILHKLTSNEPKELRADMETTDGVKAFAKYGYFYVADESELYKVTLTDFDTSSTAGNGFQLFEHTSINNKYFSTKDRDNDNLGESCASLFKGGWWYNRCHSANPNGLYGASSDAEGIVWEPFRGHGESLSKIELKIRPKTSYA